MPPTNADGGTAQLTAGDNAATGTAATAGATQPDIQGAVRAALKEIQPGLVSTLVNRTTEIVDSRLKDRLGDWKPPKADDGNGGGNGQAGQADPERLVLNTRLKESETKIAELQRTLQERDTREVEQKKRSAVMEAVDAAGVLPKLKRPLTTMLLTEANFKVLDSGVHILETRDGVDTVTSVADYVKRYVESEDGQVYLPPKGTPGIPAAGAGSTGGTRVISAEMFDIEALVKDPKKLAEASAALSQALGGIPEAGFGRR